MMRNYITLLLLSGVLFATAAQAEEEKKQGFLPKVDKPIPDTYEPLDGADWNHRTSDELETLREFQRQEKEKAQSSQSLENRRELERKIQAPDPGAKPPPAEPPIIESGDSLRIQDSE